MHKDDAVNALCDKIFLDTLFGYAYRRTNSAYEAQDLCSDIIYAALKGINGADVENFHAFVWAVARRVYADFCEKRKKHTKNTISSSYNDDVLTIMIDPIGDYIETETDAIQSERIKREISNLSKSYREVMILYYIDGLRTADISRILCISETAVKQRLFSARQTIRKEVEKMDNNNITSNINVKPIRIFYYGIGNPVGNDPSEKAERTFSQNLVYLCRNKARTAREIADMLGVPAMYVEEELDIQCRGVNGQYGLLRRLDNGKYIANFILIDQEDLAKTDAVYKTRTERIAERICGYLKQNKEKAANLPLLSGQDDFRKIAWLLIPRILWKFEINVVQTVQNRFMADIERIQRDFSTFGVASRQHESMCFDFYGNNDIWASDICGYSRTTLSNLHGNRIQTHFGCDHNMANDPLILMTIRSIGGIQTETLSNDEKETAAKAIEAGYLKKEGFALYPNIVVMDTECKESFDALRNGIFEPDDEIVLETARDLSDLVQKIVPKHLISEYHHFIRQTSGGLHHAVIEQCIANGVLNAPEDRLCGEGIMMVVRK